MSEDNRTELLHLNEDVSIVLYPQNLQLPLRCVPRVALSKATAGCETVTVYIPQQKEKK